MGDPALDFGVRWLRTADLMRRWGVARQTVLDIPRDELPWLPIGHGRKVQHRRYHPADVAAYEARYRATGVTTTTADPKEQAA